MQKEKHVRNSNDHPVSAYSTAAEADKSHSSYKRKRRSVRTPQVSTDPADYIRKKIGKLDLNDITQLARLIEGHDAGVNAPQSSEKQITIQEQIVALLDPDESPDPIMLRDSLAQLLQGNSKMSRVPQENATLAHFFEEKNNRPIKPPRKLKGLDVNTVRIPNFDIDEPLDTKTVQTRRGLKGLDLNTIRLPDYNLDAPIEPVVKPRRKLKGLDPNTIRIRKYDLDDSPDTDATLVKADITNGKKTRASSAESLKLRSEIPILKGRRPSEVIERSMRHSESPEVTARSHSIGATEVANTKRIAQLFEGNKRRHTPEPEPRSVRSGSITNEMALRLQRMNDIIEGRSRETPPMDRIKRDLTGNPEMEMRKQRVVDLIEGHKSRPILDPSQRRGSGDNQMLSFRMQRVSDIMHKKNAEAKRPKAGGRRKAQREIMKQRFEKSLQMLATEPQLEFAPSADLENDYGLQQYRASAPHFGERVKKLERQLQHYVSRVDV